MVQIHSPRPFLLEPILYITGKSEERLVRQPSVCAPYSLDQTAVCPLISLPCNRSFALLEVRFSGNYGQDQLFGKKNKSASSSASCQDTLLPTALIAGNHRRKCLSLRLCGRMVLLSVTRANRGGMPPSVSSLVRNQWQVAMELLTSQNRSGPGLLPCSPSSIPNLTCAKTSQVQLTSCFKSPATRARFQTRQR